MLCREKIVIHDIPPKQRGYQSIRLFDGRLDIISRIPIFALAQNISQRQQILTPARRVERDHNRRIFGQLPVKVQIIASHNQTRLASYILTFRPRPRPPRKAAMLFSCRSVTLITPPPAMRLLLYASVCPALAIESAASISVRRNVGIKCELR